MIRSRILTTTACNARCAYCYEKNAAILWMDNQTADETAHFLTERAKETEGSVSLEWFGGEPTLNLKAADRITARLRGTGVSCRSSIVTNGLLADECLQEHRIALWDLRLAQITLDGTARYHEAVKGFQPGAFDRILHNVSALADAGIRVKLRLNLADQADEIERLIDTLAERFSGSERILAYVNPIYPGERSYHKQTMLTVLRLNDKLLAAGLTAGRSPYDLNERSGRCFMMTSTGFTVAPDGRLYNCSHDMRKEQCVGSVRQYDPANPVRTAFLQEAPAPECVICKAFRICKGGCRIGELGFAQMPQCHPYKNVLSEIQRITDAKDVP